MAASSARDEQFFDHEDCVNEDTNSICRKRSASHPANVRRKFSLMPSSDHGLEEFVVSRLPAMLCRRSSSLPDVNALARMDCEVTFEHVAKRLSKTRSVSFHPEILGVNAAADNDVIKLAELLDRELISADYKTDSGMSMVHYAAMTGSLECLQILLDCGAEVNCIDNEGNSALDYAVRGGHFDCASLLISAGAKGERIVNGLDNFKN